MIQENYTERARGFIQSAQSLALRTNHQQLTPLHILKVLLDDKEGLAAGLIVATGGDAGSALTATEVALNNPARVEGAGAGQVYLAPATARLFDQAEQVAKKAGDTFVTAETLFLALVVVQGTDTAKILAEAGVTAQKLNTAINDMRKGRKADSASAEDGYDALKTVSYTHLTLPTTPYV